MNRAALALANLDRMHQASDTLAKLERLVAKASKAPRAVPPPRIRRSNAVSGVIAL